MHSNSVTSYENMLWFKLFANLVFFHDDFFQIQLFRKIISGIPSECQTVWIQIRPDVLWGLIWVQTVCKGNQTTPVSKALNLHIHMHRFRMGWTLYQLFTFGQKTVTKVYLSTCSLIMLALKPLGLPLLTPLLRDYSCV